MRIFFLLVLLICVLGYVRAEQPATWNSWMVALGATSAVTENPDDAGAASYSATAAARPPRTIPVGGVIQNGNFVSGEGSWQGDGRPDASGKGLVVHLNPSQWTRVYQAFSSGAGTLYSIEVTYVLSPGLALSQDPSDYTEISKRLQIDGFERFSSEPIPPGNFFGTIGDPTSTSTCCEFFAPQAGSTAAQDISTAIHPFPRTGPRRSPSLSRRAPAPSRC